ncbi:hypothetical protein BASA81_008444 [Batrachochytrium salamandrivorans]|nr:hypothetical protein BASA81_008444 [Batrachochytrium salamandrivorans]
MKLVWVLLAVWGVLVCESHSIADWGVGPLEEDGARCDISVVRRANREHLHLILQELVNTTFFRLFRVGLNGECPSFSDSLQSPGPESACSLSPSPLVEPVSTPSGDGSSGGGQCSLQLLEPNDKQIPSWIYHKEPVDRTISPHEKSSLNLDDLACDSPDFWFDLCDGLLTDSQGSGWINLQLNPERHTGYNGSKVWNEIYKQASFAGGEESGNAEQRVLTRLLSGLHASINTQIALYYYPPEKSSPLFRQWKPNPQRFMDTVGKFPDRVRNLNFAFVVLLRALKKSCQVLNSYSYAVSEDEFENQRTGQLVRRLLESHLMSSCAQVFDSFDESSMFQNKSTTLTASSLSSSGVKVKFKKAFRRISETFNCIKCQKCRLHGKMQLTGLGTALKILLLPEVSMVDLKREEVVALFNTLHKISLSIDSIDHLTELSLQDWIPPTTPTATTMDIPETIVNNKDEEELDRMVGSIAKSFYSNQLTSLEETRLLEFALGANSKMLASLAKHYGHDTNRFAMHAKRFVLSVALPVMEKESNTIVVIGSGLAGSTTVMHLLDGGASKVILIEKQPTLGGNSVYASSGMNAPVFGNDSPQIFAQDMATSSGRGLEFASTPLVQTLVHSAGEALGWIQTRTQLDFSQLGKLGGHSLPRTWRPIQGLAGSELLSYIHHLFQPFVASGRLQIWKSARVIDVQQYDSHGFTVRIKQLTNDTMLSQVSHVVFATGGFAANKSMVPSTLARFKTTNMPGATGDAIPLLERLGAKFIDLDLVQLHPTAFVVGNGIEQQPLCAEIMRGVGGILLNSRGERFCNELGTRAYVSQQMLAQTASEFTLLLSAEQATNAGVFPKMYMKKGLLRELNSLDEVSEFVGTEVAPAMVRYASYKAQDEFGKTEFANASSLLTSSKYYVGKVRPALHYCMGGVAVNAQGQVLGPDNSVLLDGKLFAVGEVSGGLHGNNRLGGNGMTEALVFGRKVAETILGKQSASVPLVEETASQKQPLLPAISKQELAGRNLWVAIRGLVYDFSQFAKDHPGGELVIQSLSGTDGTEQFEEIHTPSVLQGFEPVGRLV